MVKRICALVCALLLPLSAGAELIWPATLTEGQAELKAYIELVNQNQSLQGRGWVNSLFECYPTFATMGMTILYGANGEILTEKSGNLNLGVPGMMYMGGIGGLIYVIPISPTFGGDVYGYGFLAMSVLMLGQWKPVRLLAAAFLFSLIKTVAAGYMSIPFLSDIGLSDNFYKSLPYIITLLVLTFSANRAIGPKAAGQPYDKGRR